jgi:hypothetical protein
LYTAILLPTLLVAMAQATLARTPCKLPSAAAVLRCDEPVYDFGTVWAGEKVYHEFKVTNTSDEVVWVRVIPAMSCGGPGCSWVVRIGPKEVGFIPTNLSTGHVRGEVVKNFALEIERTEPATRPSR